MPNETPYEWCERMEREAKDGDEAYRYFQLKEMWKIRDERPDL